MLFLVQDYLASLKEREELDAILPDLLRAMGFQIVKLAFRFQNMQNLANLPVEPLNLPIVIAYIGAYIFAVRQARGHLNICKVHSTFEPRLPLVASMRVAAAEPEAKRPVLRPGPEEFGKVLVARPRRITRPAPRPPLTRTPTLPHISDMITGLPVTIEPRDGVHEGAVTNALVKSTPSRATRSKVGVLTTLSAAMLA